MASQGQRFRRKALRRGYKVDEVDEFLDRVEATLAGTPNGAPVSAQEVHDVVFRVRFGGYDEWQVDLHLDRAERQIAELEERRSSAPRAPERPGPPRDGLPRDDRLGPPRDDRIGPPRDERVGAPMGPPDRFGPPAERMGPPLDRPGPSDRFGPPRDERVGAPMGPSDRFGPPPDRMGPPVDRMGTGDLYGPPPSDPFGGPPPERMGADRMGPHPDRVGPPARDDRGGPPSRPVPPTQAGPYGRYEEPTGGFAAPRGGFENPRGPMPPGGGPVPAGPVSGGPAGPPPGARTGGPGGFPPADRFSGFEAGRHGKADMTAEIRMPDREPRPPVRAPQGMPPGAAAGMPGPGGPGGLTGEAQRVDQIRRTFQVRRFGSGYDPEQVDRLFDGIVTSMSGRGPMPVNPAELDTLRFGLVPGGYFEAEVDAALREVKDILHRR